jgi:hypothetical protein
MCWPKGRPNPKSEAVRAAISAGWERRRAAKDRRRDPAVRTQIAGKLRGRPLSEAHRATLRSAERSERKVVGVCTYCGDPADTFDHLVAGVGPLVPACVPCNSSKGDKDMADWLDYLGRLATRGAWARKRIDNLSNWPLALYEDREVA